jgi:hypothetical protein
VYGVASGFCRLQVLQPVNAIPICRAKGSQHRIANAADERDLRALLS